MTKKVKGFSPARKFKYDDKALNEGTWVEIEDGAAKLLIARFNNEAHAEYLRKERAKNTKLLEDDSSAESQKLLRDLGNRAMAKFVLKGWEGILDEDGESELPYSEEAAFKLLDELEDFSNLVFSLSMEASRYRMYEEGRAVKN